MSVRLRLESRLALLVGALFGLPAVFLVPPAATFDGPSHYFRALQVSQGRMRPEYYSETAVGGTLPRSHVDFVNTLWRSYWVGRDFGTIPGWSALAARSLKDAGATRVEFTNTAIYSPANYALQATGMRAASWLTPSPLAAHWAACLCNLAGYLGLVVAAIELLPRFRWGALLLATCPLAVIQAASVSADPINFAAPLLVMASAWRLRAQAARASAVDLAVVLSAGLVTVLLKPTAAASLACVALIPGRHFGPRRAKFGYLCAYFLCAAGAWYAWNRANMNVDVARWFEPDHPPLAAQKAWFIGDPRRFIEPFRYLLLANDLAPQWPHMFCDVGGWIPPGLYKPLSWLSLVVLAGLVACGSWREPADWRWAAVLAFQSFAILFLVALALWVSFGTVGAHHVPGFTGRYLPPIAMGLAAAGAEAWHSGLPRLRLGLSWAALAANCVGLTAILASIASRTA
jgi:hypothetical protein